MDRVVMLGTWRMSLEGIETAISKLLQGESALEAVVEAIQAVEDHPEYHSVGYSGLPNREGVVELDAGIMEGDGLRVGAVASLQGYRNPILIAKSLMKRRSSFFLVGEGAHQYAQSLGLKRENLLSEASQKRWQMQRTEHADPASLVYDGHDTVGVLARDRQGLLVAGTSTSGIFMKEPGRVGDSPLPGCGYYADSEIGAVVATGFGEDILRGNLCYDVMERLAEGLDPMLAAETSLNKWVKRLQKGGQEPGDMSLLCLNVQGQWGAATNAQHFSFVVADEDAAKVYLVGRNKAITEADELWISTHKE